jgi:hypothetical protein
MVQGQIREVPGKVGSKKPKSAHQKNNQDDLTRFHIFIDLETFL